MLWYGYLYFFIFYFILLSGIIFLIKLFHSSSITKLNIYTYVSKLLLSMFLYSFSFILFMIYYIFEIFSHQLTWFNHFYFVNQNFLFNFWFDFSILNTNFLDIYFFPFIYIFILITFLSILFCLSYNLNELISFFFYSFMVLLAGMLLFFTDSIILFFFYYEMLLIPSFLILYKFAKTRRCVEAAYLMFFWTQFGALFLILSFIYLFLLTGTTSFTLISEYQFSKFEINFLFFCWLVGFGVKLPVWPFYNWLPKAHVEASTNFSIFLSGVLVKFAFFGLLKCLITIELEPSFFWIYPFLTIGITDAVFKLFYQIDLKKLVAYSTVVEMHWLTICVVSGQTALMLSSFCMLISHALLSTNSFLLVDAVNRRFKTRLITEISGINFLCPKLFIIILINCLVFLGFPGSIFFIAEVLFFSFFFDLFPILAIFLLLLLYFFGPTFFFRSWMNLMFGLSVLINKSVPLDLNTKELVIYSGLIILMFWLGVTWQSFIF